ncbi:MAG: hypothetical protein NVS2B14_08880 [Chamaesiphon sp.]
MANESPTVIGAQEFYRNCYLCSSAADEQWDAWILPQGFGEWMPFTSRLFPTPDKALAYMKWRIEQTANAPYIKHMRSVLEGVGICSSRIDIFVKPWAGHESTKEDMALIPHIWQEAALKGGEIYRGHCIVVYYSESQWYWVSGGGDSISWFSDERLGYPTRSKALLEARKFILQHEVEMELANFLEDALDDKLINFREYSRLSDSLSNCGGTR